MASETYPNGMIACYTRNSVGEATALEYFKSSSCGTGSVWYHDSVAPSIHGQSLSQESSLSSESYAYDEAGTLTEVQETPVGKGCMTRLYGYDEDGDRTSLTTREPAAGGGCATKGGSVEGHSYDTASGVVAMGARSYVPELGRFLQPDPQPGGSANAYAYTHGDPVNEEDPSGEWTLNETSGGLSAVGEGPGENLAGGVGIGAGAVMPAPVNTQIEAEFEADPPWDQVTAGSEELEEFEEYWEYEEEGGWEYVSDHGGKEGHAEAHIEPALLYQPLGEASIEGSEHEHSEHGGNTHDASGDGCGDGGYCGGHWVRRSEKGHRHGEPIGEDPREEVEIGVCLAGWAFGPVGGAFSCAAAAGMHFVPTH